MPLLNRIKALEKQEKHKLSGTIKEKHRPHVTLHNLTRRSKSLRDDDIIDPPAKKQGSNLDFEEDLAGVYLFVCLFVWVFLPKKTRSLMTSMSSF